MLALTFSLHDSFFIKGEFYQILPCTSPGKVLLRKHCGSRFELKENTPTEIFSGCKIKLGEYPNSKNFKLYFDAPRSVEIVRAGAYQKDGFQDDILMPNASERTIDQLLEEEFLINAKFSETFISRCFSGSLSNIEVISAYRSARQRQSGGDETDLLVIFTDGGQDRNYALMIENKITASKQELQPERYIQRGMNGIRAERWDAFETCLIAPKQYLGSKKEDDYYHNYVSYEEIIKFMEQAITDEKRLNFRKKCFEDAIQKKEKFIRAPDLPAALEFVAHLAATAQEMIPEMEFAAEPPNSPIIWFMFTRKDYPEGIRIIVKKEDVTIEFKLPKYSELIKAKEVEFKEGGYEFKMAKSSCTIRKPIAPINCLRPFSEQKKNINLAISYIRQMDEFLRMKVL